MQTFSRPGNNLHASAISLQRKAQQFRGFQRNLHILQ